jgi:hypothetical protein
MSKQIKVAKQLDKFSKKSSLIPETISVIHETNIDWKKIKQLLKIFLISMGMTILVILLLPQIQKYLPKYIALQKPKQKIEFKSQGTIYYFDPINLVNNPDIETRDYLLVDTRSMAEFQIGHIKGAKNAPLYSDYQKIDKTNVKLSDFFNNIKKINIGNKPVVLYGYFSRAQILLDSAQYLSQNGTPTQLLSVSWYEFKNNPFSWLPGNDQGTIEINKYLEGKMYENK